MVGAEARHSARDCRVRARRFWGAWSLGNSNLVDYFPPRSKFKVFEVSSLTLFHYEIVAPHGEGPRAVAQVPEGERERESRKGRISVEGDLISRTVFTK